MARFFWVRITFPGGVVRWYCVPGKVGRQCFSPSFAFLDQSDDSLRELTGQVNSLLETFAGDHPDQTLRILETEDSDVGGQLSFAFVATDLEISIPDSS